MQKYSTNKSPPPTTMIGGIIVTAIKNLHFMVALPRIFENTQGKTKKSTRFLSVP
jgi:hypothetical protein